MVATRGISQIMCGALQIKPLVNNADALLKLSKKVLGSTIVNGVVKRTFFRHFCAGEALFTA